MLNQEIYTQGRHITSILTQIYLCVSLKHTFPFLLHKETIKFKIQNNGIRMGTSGLHSWSWSSNVNITNNPNKPTSQRLNLSHSEPSQTIIICNPLLFVPSYGYLLEIWDPTHLWKSHLFSFWASSSSEIYHEEPEERSFDCCCCGVLLAAFFYYFTYCQSWFVGEKGSEVEESGVIWCKDEPLFIWFGY